MSIINYKHTDHKISNNNFEPTDHKISTVNFEYTDHEYKDIPFQIHLNYSSVGHDYLSNWHNELEFIYTVSGSVEVYIENNLYVTKPGDIVAINKNKIHTFKGDNWTFHCLKTAHPILQALDLSHNIFIPQPLIQDEELVSAFLNIVEECHKERTFKKQFLTLAIQNFLLLFFEKYSRNNFAETETKKNTHFEIAVDVINYLNQHLSENFSVDTIAEELGISSSHLSRCFKEATGVSVVDYLNRLRCYVAKNYLMHSDKKISDIAVLCGYQNNSYFARTYKKIVGCSPNETPRNTGFQ